MPFLNERGLKRSLADLWDRTKAYIDGQPYGDQNAFLVKAPVGAIVIWSGTAADIPAGWQLCDGTNGTPDLLDKFVLGAGENHPVGETGGAEEVTLTTEQMPEHQHRSYFINNALQSGTNVRHVSAVENSQGTAQSTEPVGGSQPHENMPPYYALCYIMKMTADEGDGIPIIPISYEAYQALSEAEKNRDDVIWLVEDAPEQPSLTVSIEEYDTADGWHVRKWSNGYVEMMTKQTHTISPERWSSNGALYSIQSNVFDYLPLPVELVELYFESLNPLQGSAGFFLQPPGATNPSPLIQTSRTHLIRTTIPENQRDYTVMYYITGRWK